MVGPAPPPPRRGRGCVGCLIAAVVVTVLAVIAGVTGYRYFQPVEGQLNKPSKDGHFTFVASTVSCGGTVRGLTPYTGNKFCRARITVTNTGTETRTFSRNWQKLVDDDGDSHEARLMVKGTTADARNREPVKVLIPGDKFTGLLVFEIPATSRPVSLVLHDARLSKGVRIPARTN